MMKNYFENETTILPFDKVLSIHKNKDSLYICIGFDNGNGIGSSFPIDQLVDYKAWLDANGKSLEKETYEYVIDNGQNELNQSEMQTSFQSNSQEILTSCSCSEKENNLEKFRNNPELVDVFNNLPIQKANNSNTTINVTILTKKQKDNLREMFQKEIAKYQNIDMILIDDSLVETVWDNALYWIETNLKQNSSNHLPEVGKTILSREQVNKIIDVFSGWCGCCSHKTLTMSEEPCLNCIDDEKATKFELSDDFVKEINELIKEK